MDMLKHGFGLANVVPADDYRFLEKNDGTQSYAAWTAKRGKFKKMTDVIILPSLLPERIAGGLSQDAVPPGYAGGLGDAGGRALKTFVENGGTLVTLDQAGGYAISALGLPDVEVECGA